MIEWDEPVRCSVGIFGIGMVSVCVLDAEVVAALCGGPDIVLLLSVCSGHWNGMISGGHIACSSNKQRQYPNSIS